MPRAVMLLCVIAWAVTLAAAVHVPQSQHRLKQQQRRATKSKAAVAVPHNECLAEVRKFLDANSAVVGVPRVGVGNRAHDLLASDMGGYQDADAREVSGGFKPAMFDAARSICKITADWIFGGIYQGWDRTLNGNAGGVRETPTTHLAKYGLSAGLAAPNNWADTVLWHNFPAHGRVCYVDLRDMGQRPLTHQFVIEAPAMHRIRHLQSFVECYTAADWIGTHTGFRDFVQYRPENDCDPFAAKLRHGGGQLLDTTQGNGALWLADMQTLVDAFHTQQGGANTNLFAALQQAYANLFGVHVANGHHMLLDSFMRFHCVDRVPTRCASNSRDLRAAVTRWNNRLALHIPTIDGTTAPNQAFVHDTAALRSYLTARTYAQAQVAANGQWQTLVNNANARAAQYEAFVDKLQKGWCPSTGLFQNGGQYKVVLRNSAPFLALTAGNNPIQVQGTRGGFFKYVAKLHPLHTTFDIRCMNAGAGTPGFANAPFQAQCTAWQIRVNGGNGNWEPVHVPPSSCPAARWELQVCLDGTHNVRPAANGHGGARFLPSGKLW